VNIEVPDYILDLIPIEAGRYTREENVKFFATNPEIEPSEILKKSTHHLCHFEERRELHRKILEASVAHLGSDIPDGKAKCIHHPSLYDLVSAIYCPYFG